jgi:hypothetical protein
LVCQSLNSVAATLSVAWTSATWTSRVTVGSPRLTSGRAARIRSASAKCSPAGRGWLWCAVPGPDSVSGQGPGLLYQAPAGGALVGAIVRGFADGLRPAVVPVVGHAWARTRTPGRYRPGRHPPGSGRRPSAAAPGACGGDRRALSQRDRQRSDRTAFGEGQCHGLPRTVGPRRSQPPAWTGALGRRSSGRDHDTVTEPLPRSRNYVVTIPAT